ncbi:MULTISPECIES: MFS transporter [Kitasatospora]|uniref:MFS transporter n=1 Tax=Kitasatospora cystarginea TaxID=58350 RepID=A0ABP5RRM4_9ACTN
MSVSVTAEPGSLFRHRGFFLLWSSQSVSFLGTQITYVALPLTAVLVLNATPMESGLMGALEKLPFLLFGLFVGVFVDRRARRPILVWTNAVRFAALTWIPVAYLLDMLTMGQLFLVVFVVGTMTVFFEIAYPSYVPGLVGRERLMEANSKLQVSESVAEVAGPGTAGVLISALSAPVVIVLDAVSYAVSALALAKLPADAAPRTAEDTDRKAPSVWTSVREGFSVIKQHAVLRWCTVAAVFTSLSFSAVMAVYFLFLIREAEVGAAAIGVITAVGSAGALCGALVADRLTLRWGVGPTLVLSLVFPALGYLVLAGVHGSSFWAVATAAVASFIALFGIPVFDVTVISYRQAVTPDHLLGRVNATVRTFAWGALSIGSLLGGALGTALGLRQAVLVSAIGLLVPSLILFLSPARRVRRLDEAAQAAAEPKAPEPSLPLNL